MTNFIVHFSHDPPLRVWDAFLIEGHKIIYRAAIAIFVKHADFYAKSDFEEIFSQIRQTCETV